MEIERTLILLKPDAVQRSLIGSIISRLETKGLQIVGMKMLQVSQELAHKHYGIHKDKPFFDSLVEFITSSPIVALVLEGPNAVEMVRSSMGTTNPVHASPGTIRGDLAVDIGYNLIHGSDSMETAHHEISLFFDEDEVLTYERAMERWITGP